MSGQTGLIAIIFGVPALLVVGAITGSMLGAARRRFVEIFVLLPLLILLGAGGLTLMFVQRHWLGMAFLAVSLAIALERFLRYIRSIHPGSQRT